MQSNQNHEQHPLLKNVSRETLEQLHAYVELLLYWNKRINLIDRKTEQIIWDRHIIDSAQIAKLIPDQAKTLIDYGSGAGLPGMVLAILEPELQVTCCERDQRKAIFLQEARRTLELKNVTVEACDVADINARYDVVSARAFTSLDKLLGLAIHHLAPHGICCFPKGKMHAKEIVMAKQDCAFDCEEMTSETDVQARILRIRNLSKIS